MKSNGKNQRDTRQPISDGLRRYLEAIPPVPEAGLGKLREARDELAADPGFQAESLKSLFIEKMLLAMETKGISKSELAKRWTKSRQYISKVLHEDRSVNFTIETMAELAHLLDLRIEILVRDAHQPAGRKMEAEPGKPAARAAAKPSRVQPAHGNGAARTLKAHTALWKGSRPNINPAQQ